MNMPPFSTSALREHQLALLREMAGSLTQAKAAMLSSDLAGFEFQTERQGVLCQQWDLLRAQALASTVPNGDAVSPDLTEAVCQVRDRLRVHAALLRRARRTGGIFCRVLATSGATYIVPPADTGPAVGP